MTLEIFFEKFNQFADAPDAVAKMRELVLQLAVQGKLVPFDADGEEQTVGDHIEFQNGYAFKSEWFKPSGMRLCRNLNVSHGNLDWRESAFVDDKVAKEFERFALGEGDIVLSLDRPLIATGLKVARVTQADLPCLLLQRVAKPVPKHDQLDLSYFMLWLNSSEFVDSIDPGRSNGVPHISTRQVQRLPFALPPLAEQKRIVAKVDELMALCDRLEAQQAERETRHAALARASLARFADAPTPANLNFIFHKSYTIPPADLRKSILTLAVQGKLVPQDPNDEPADVTFPMLAAAAIEADEDGFPAHWLRVPLGKTGEWRGGGTPSKSRPDFWKGDLPWVSPKDMKVLHVSDAQDHISEAAVEGSSVRLIPPGSLLMVVRGMILARAFPVALTTKEVTINQDMKALLPSEPKTKEYLLVALRAFEPDVLAAIEHSSHGTCKLKTEFLQDFVLPVPPLAEQRRIVAKVEQLMALVDALETQLAASRATAANLLSALVAELTAA